LGFAGMCFAVVDLITLPVKVVWRIRERWKSKKIEKEWKSVSQSFCKVFHVRLPALQPGGIFLINHALTRAWRLACVETERQ
jgi:hypothetical protein